MYLGTNGTFINTSLIFLISLKQTISFKAVTFPLWMVRYFVYSATHILERSLASQYPVACLSSRTLSNKEHHLSQTLRVWPDHDVLPLIETMHFNIGWLSSVSLNCGVPTHSTLPTLQNVSQLVLFVVPPTTDLVVQVIDIAFAKAAHSCIGCCDH